MREVAERDFTFAKYERLCHTLRESGYGFLTVIDYMGQPPSESKHVVMRHDVDRKVANALRMARIENEMEIRSTYYFRKARGTFEPDVIREVSDLGHEIGYHYEVLTRSRGDYDKAIHLFEEELSAFRAVCDVRTICMHSRPERRWDNRDLWKKYDFQAYGIEAEAYLSLDYGQAIYLSDSGRNWNTRRYKLRDEVDGCDAPEVNTTDDVMALIRTGRVKRLVLVVHPNRWSEGALEWGVSLLSDTVINMGKSVIRLMRGGGTNA